MAISKLGQSLRPKAYQDDEGSASRGRLWLFSVLLVIALLMLTFMYNLSNAGMKQATLKNPTADAAKDLFKQQAAGEIWGVQCKCMEEKQQKLPALKDLDDANLRYRCGESFSGDCAYTNDYVCDEPFTTDGSPGTGICNSGTDTADCTRAGGGCPYANDGECDEDFHEDGSAGYGICDPGTDTADCSISGRRLQTKPRSSSKRALEEWWEVWDDDSAWLEGGAGYGGRGVAQYPAEYLCEALWMKLYYERHTAKVKVSKLYDSERYADEMLSDYNADCLSEVYSQISVLNVLVGSLDTIVEGGGTLDSSDPAILRQEVLDVYDGNLQMAIDRTCFAPVDPEEERLKEAWAAHYESCAPPQCTYDKDEGPFDSLLKTLALASPLLSGTMAAAALFYTKLHHKKQSGVKPYTETSETTSTTQGSGP